jgi:hypothetical protein
MTHRIATYAPGSKRPCFGLTQDSSTRGPWICKVLPTFQASLINYSFHTHYWRRFSDQRIGLYRVAHMSGPKEDDVALSPVV